MTSSVPLLRAEVENGEHGEESVRIVIQQADLKEAVIRSEVEKSDLKWIPLSCAVDPPDLDPMLQAPVYDAHIEAGLVAHAGVVRDRADLHALNGGPQIPSDLASVQGPVAAGVAIPRDHLQSVVLSFVKTAKGDVDPVELFFERQAFDGNTVRPAAPFEREEENAVLHGVPDRGIRRIQDADRDPVIIRFLGKLA